MAVKKSYNRYFIIFQEEDKGYGIAIDKQPTGYTKIENRSGKCKITAYAQNLVKEKGPYYCCLVDSSKDPLVMAKLGTVNIDDTGRGETWWEFKEDDIADTGVAFDRFNVAAIITEDNKIYAPLAGYIGKDKVSWKDRVPFISRVEEEPVKEEKPAVNKENEENEENEENVEMNEEAKKFKEYEEDIKSDSENKGERWKKEKDKKENPKGESKSKDENKEDKKEESNNKGNENKKENSKPEANKSENKKDNSGEKDKENKKDNPKDDSKAPGKDNPKEGSKAPGKENPKDDPKANPNENPKAQANKSGNQSNFIEPFNYDEDIEAKEVSGYMNDNFDRKGDREKRPFATMFHDVLEDFDKEDNLTDEFANTKWWKIPLSENPPISENAYYPYYCAVYHLKMTYPYINYVKYFKDTGHYHFGMRYDNDGEVKYILYGIEGSNAHNLQPYMGMTGFIRWIKMKNTDNGMWIMYYNPHTGNIMIPKKK